MSKDNYDAALTERAAAAARAELRGERENMLGAIGIAGPAPLSRAREVPERWTFLFVMERMEEGFRILSRLPLPIRPKGYINSMPIYLHDQADLNSQLETYELERPARTRNRVRILPSPAEIERMEEALYWPSAYLSGREFSAPKSSTNTLGRSVLHSTLSHKVRAGEGTGFDHRHFQSFHAAALSRSYCQAHSRSRCGNGIPAARYTRRYRRPFAACGKF
jgi:hypothetical protein